MPQDVIQGRFEVGDVVNVPCVVTAATGDVKPALTLTTKYKGFDGNADSVSVDSCQVITAK